jgi:UDP-glucose 4-epimerase
MREGGGSLVANCGYGTGFSVLEVLETVKKVHGRPFEIRYAGRRPGDAVSIVANPAIAKRELNWQPQHDDLEFIVRTALDWEAHLARRNDR